ncbi:MAG: hypothetical protein K2Q24_04120 [Chitinophagaceae bacterium]|nr:hypothetical protein [Chitinophagaceae bacterium]
MINIYTVSDKRPDFISLQYNGFKKFLKDKDYKFIVCNNGSTSELRNEIADICNKLGLTSVYVEGNYENGAIATQVPLIYCLKNYIRHDPKEDMTVIIDSDIFLFNNFSFTELLEGADIAGIYQQRDRQAKKIFLRNHYYLWNAFLVFKNSSIDFEKFDISMIQNITDVGGNLHYYLERFKPKVKWVVHTPDIEDESEIFIDGLREIYHPQFGMQIIASSFIHYYRGSNWDALNNNYHELKTGFLVKFLETARKQYPLTPKLHNYQDDCAHTKRHYNGTRHNTKSRFRISNKLYRLKWFG